MRGKTFSRVVIDTNIYIGQILNYRSKPSLAILKAERSGEILLSKAIFSEVADVIRRQKFDRYVGLERNQSWCALLRFVEGRRSLVVAST
jgi:putative PIN family toxin of toxin-antitoxin system